MAPKPPSTACVPRSLISLAAAAALAFSTPTAFAGDGQEFDLLMTNTGVLADGHAKLGLELGQDGNDRFEAKLEGVPEGGYDLYVGDLDTPRGVIEVTLHEENELAGKLRFATDGDGVKELLLDFPVLDQPIQIRQADVLLFAKDFSADAGSSDDLGDVEDELELLLVSTGVDFDAEGKLEFKAKQGKLRLDVKLHGLDPGLYLLRVGGEKTAEFEVLPATDLKDDSVTLRFSHPFAPEGEGLEFELTFDPLGRQVEVVFVDPVAGSEAVVLSAVLPASAAETGSKSPKHPSSSSKDTGTKGDDGLKVRLSNTGLVVGGKSEAEMRMSSERTRFGVVVENLAPGDYELHVDGVLRGSISVGADAEEGEIIFSTTPEGTQLLLDYDVRGALIEVLSGSDVLFAGVFPLSVAAALDKGKKEKHTAAVVRVNLVNSGEDLDANGLATDKSPGTRERLIVKVDELPAGEYAVYIDGIQRGVIVVKRDEKSAKLIFDSKLTEPKGKKLPLDFPVVGLLLEIRSLDGATVWLQVVVN